MVVQKQPSARGKWIIWEIFIYRQWNVNFIYCSCVMIIFFWFSFQLFQNTKPLLAWGSYKHRRRITCDPQAIVSWSLCCCSDAKLCLTLCDRMDCSRPGFAVLHYLSKFAQTHVHRVGEAIQPSHPLSPPSPLALNLSQHQDLFQRVSSSHQVTKVLELQLQHVLPVNINGWFPLGRTGWISLQSKGLSKVFSSTIQKHQFFGAQPSLWSNSDIHIWPLEKPQLWLYGLLLEEWCLCFLVHCLVLW